jgi:purine nucleoside permease
LDYYQVSVQVCVIDKDREAVLTSRSVGNEAGRIEVKRVFVIPLVASLTGSTFHRTNIHRKREAMKYRFPFKI